MNRDLARGMAIVVTVALAMMGGVQTASTALGLTDQQVAWLGILATGLGVLNGFLPRVQSSGTPDPND